MRRLFDRLAVVFAILSWELLVWLYAGLIPAPTQVLKALIVVVMEDSLGQHVLISFIRVFCGVVVAMIFGFLAALLAKILPIRTFVELLRPIPPIAWIPLVFILFGSGELGSIFIIFLGVFFPFFSTVSYELDNVSNGYLINCRSLGFGRLERWRYCILP